jgi:hypothetical protein
VWHVGWKHEYELDESGYMLPNGDYNPDELVFIALRRTGSVPRRAAAEAAAAC